MEWCLKGQTVQMGRTVISLIFLFLAFNHYLISTTFTYLDLILLLALSLILE